MVEQSIKFLYLGAAVLLFIIAIASFYQQEKKFISYYDAVQEAQQGNNWLKPSALKSMDALAIDSGISSDSKTALTSFQASDHGRTLILESEALKSWLYGMLIYADVSNKKRLGTVLHETAQDLVRDDTLLDLQLSIYWEGVRLLPGVFDTRMNSIQDNALYGVLYKSDEKSYYITKID